MKKLLGIICPYIILFVVYLLSKLQSNYVTIINAIIAGVMIGIWYYCIISSEGSKSMMVMMILNIIIFIVGIVAVNMIAELDFLQNNVPIASIFIGLECVALYVINKNQPRLAMTYKYSYKNKRRRYF